MNDPSDLPNELLAPIARVVTAALPHADGLQPKEVMVVGAVCRDLHHYALGHRFAATATHDLDLALALPSWEAFRGLAAAFPQIGETGIRFRIADVTVDLLPFGVIEDPAGAAQPPTRSDPLSVWAFSEIFASALPLPLPAGMTVKLPTVAGYAAAKLGAWLDRSEWHEAKDAADVALVLYWYGESSSVHDRLYETEAGNEVLAAESTDLSLAAARLLGRDISATIGTARLAELLARWPGDMQLLVRELGFVGATWPRDAARRRALLEALTRGITDRDG
jgi:predicted nucleotidyltransferase